MLKENKIRCSCLLALAIIMTICAAFLPSAMDGIAFAADEHISTEIIDFTSNADAFAYSIAPTHIYPFIYYGIEPTPYLDIDTSSCLVNYLYTHNSNTNSVHQISTNEVITYTATSDNIFYIDKDYKVYISDFTGSNRISVFQLEEKNYSNFDYFDGLLYFIENDRCVSTIDIATRQKSSIIQSDAITSVVMLDRQKAIWQDDNYTDFVYDATTQTSVACSSPYEANCLVAEYALDIPASDLYSVMSNISGDINDISMPFAGTVYDAPLHSTHDWTFTASYYFHRIEGQESVPKCVHPFRADDEREYVGMCAGYAGDGECAGFAKFAHDRYYHIEDWSKSSPTNWCLSSEITERFEFDSVNDWVLGVESAERVRQEFDNMLPGTYIRYGKVLNPNNGGAHSMVFISTYGDSGILVYEANQDTACGIHYQYWPYSVILGNYNYIHHKVEHTFTNDYTNHNALKHKYNCDTSGCNAYLLQRHTGSIYYTPNNALGHLMGASCCSGTVLVPHTIVGNACFECGYVIK